MTMNRIIKRIVKAAIIASMCVCFSGCANGTSAKENASYTVIAGVHSNSRVIPFNSETFKAVLEEICYRFAHVTFINCDSDPEPYFQTKIPEPSVKNLSEEKKRTIAESYVKQLIDIVQQATPDSAEFDTLKAIQKAAQSLNDYDNDTYDKDLLILDSGLSTTGYLDFTTGLLYADPEVVVDTLEEVDAIPDLDGVDVAWAFLGDVGAPQKSLTAGEKENLRNIWEAVLYAAGAKSVVFTNDFSSTDTYKGLPMVSTVDVGDEKIKVEYLREDKTPEISITDPIETVVLDNASVQFVGDKAVFLNEKKAREAIGKVAKLLEEHPDNKVYVIGTTATGDDDPAFCKDLSDRRAKAVVNVLVEMGVDESRLLPMGLGYEDYWHVKDIDDDGTWIEEEAVKNRKVLIIDVNSDDAKYVP